MSRTYVGGELELFAAATNWKRYFGKVLQPYIAGRVLDVGAGIGSNIPYLYNERVVEWTSLEPDPKLASTIEATIAAGALPRGCRVAVGTLAESDPGTRYDTVLYIDVLEHIDDDAAELAAAAQHLAPDGNLIVLAPAHQFLFSALDEAVGHHRRYNARSLTALEPPGCRLHTCLMLDAAGFFASLANAALLQASIPSERQIRVWDGCLVPISRVLDRCTGHRFGKTVVAVWSRTAADA